VAGARALDTKPEAHELTVQNELPNGVQNEMATILSCLLRIQWE
jgi:hypothetical protein